MATKLDRQLVLQRRKVDELANTGPGYLLMLAAGGQCPEFSV